MEVISTGMGESTIGGLCRVVLPLSAPTSGPKSLLAMMTSRGGNWVVWEAACLQDLNEIFV